MTAPTRPRVVYVSYDGAGEPLGRGQVLAYLRLLARSCDITLISFEKDEESRPETARILAEAGIGWRALDYHKRPPVLSTLLDVLAGVRALRRACAQADAEIVHVRSYVPALIAVLARRRGARRRLVFDIRGFWADERVEGGMWPRGGWLYRLAKRCERWFFAEADAVVTLTAASVPDIRRLGAASCPVEVIPTCAELDRFAAVAGPGERPRIVWCGSVGTFYRFDLAVGMARASGLPLLVLTRQLDTARAQLAGVEAQVREVRPEQVPGELRAGDIGASFYAGSYGPGEGAFANLARAPTRFAEYLAAGMVAAVSPGIGDLDVLVEEHDVGVTVHDTSEAGLRDAVERALALRRDPGFGERAQRLARERFRVQDGAERYLALYLRLTGRERSGEPEPEREPEAAAP